MIASRKIRVLVVDDSAVVRKLASEVLASDPDLEVVGTAVDPYVAQEKIAALNPDVITLDLEMPRMDGLTFLRRLMVSHPLPVVVMSTLTDRGSDYALEALRLGAVEVIGKPAGPHSLEAHATDLIHKVKAAARARLRPAPAAEPTIARSPVAGTYEGDPRAVILLGASTGGVEALREVLTHLPANLPPIAIVQHIPAAFSKAFAQRLNSLCALDVREAVDGERLSPGTALIAPGNFHLMLQWSGGGYRARVASGPTVWHQRPAVDLLFKSAAECGGGPHAIAGLLTGMGQDGAEGLLRLKEKGAATFVQDEATSVVYGMPRAAVANGATRLQFPLERIARHLIHRAGATSLTPVSS